MQEIFLIVDIIISIAAVLGGHYMKFRAANDEKMELGFRTPRSEKSYDTWTYANTECGGKWLIIGVCGLAASVAAMLFNGQLSDTAAAVISVLILVVIVAALSSSAVSVMKGLISRFDDDGRPIERE